MDWAMKFLSVQFRETQSEFFSKKGLSWHISCSVTRSAASDELRSQLLHSHTGKWDTRLVFYCKYFAPFAGTTQVFIQQNNSTFPIRIKEYNFSEAQSGKDLCDSKTGSSRLHIYRYANEGHNVLNAGDMKKALEAMEASEPKIKSKIPGISVLNNFVFTEIGIVARKAYQVGSGQLIQTSGISDQNLCKERVFNLEDTQINLIQTVSAATQSDAISNMINKGWALKGKRTNIRFSPKVKSYLNEICLNCEKTGKRPNYFALSDELRKSCDENGERMFKMEEWLNPTQIKSYFATLVTKLKSGTINFNSITDNNDVQSIELKEIEENVEQDEKLYEAVAVIEANTNNENVENFVDEVYTAVNM
ncbi:unnamed protein product [Mytilus coruscus]|uniref:Uncharacterized protein n=1 Tax=Mytilus coruscus TaxID=42192 RepID=A0A6J8BTQ0_MYTCO|nr:unnamed protein product [Mytilus coruscus]